MQKPILYPHFLSKGDKISINAPARKVTPTEMQAFIQLLERQDLDVQIGKNLYKAHGPYAGNDKERLDCLQESLDNPEIKAIFFARGGYGCIRIIDQLDFSKFKKNPKWLIGYSDICILHFKLQQMGIASIHAPMGISFKSYNFNNPNKNDVFSFNNMMSILFNSSSDKIIPISNIYNYSQAFEGKLLGGNLAILYSLLGSDSLPNFNNAVLFLEDIGEYLYNIDRMMIGLRRAGIFNHLKGLIIGGMTDMEDNKAPFNFNRSPTDIILDSVKEFNFPVIFNFPAGHLDKQESLILGKVIKCDGKNLYL